MIDVSIKIIGIKKIDKHLQKFDKHLNKMINILKNPKPCMHFF